MKFPNNRGDTITATMVNCWKPCKGYVIGCWSFHYLRPEFPWGSLPFQGEETVPMCGIRDKSPHTKVKVGIYWLVCPSILYLSLNFSIVFFPQVAKTVPSRTSMTPEHRLRIDGAAVFWSYSCDSSKSPSKY